MRTGKSYSQPLVSLLKTAFLKIFWTKSKNTSPIRSGVRPDPQSDTIQAIRSWFRWRPVKTSWIMMMQPSTTMMKILKFRNYLKKPSSFPSNQRLVSWYLFYFNNLFNLDQMYQVKTEESKYISMRMDSAERLAFSFIYSNTQFREKKKQSIFKMKKVNSSFLVQLHWSI